MIVMDKSAMGRDVHRVDQSGITFTPKVMDRAQCANRGQVGSSVSSTAREPHMGMDIALQRPGDVMKVASPDTSTFGAAWEQAAVGRAARHGIKMRTKRFVPHPVP